MRLARLLLFLMILFVEFCESVALIMILLTSVNTYPRQGGNISCILLCIQCVLYFDEEKRSLVSLFCVAFLLSHKMLGREKLATLYIPDKEDFLEAAGNWSRMV